jgi:hypothetical protein
VDRAVAFETAIDAAKTKADLAKGIHDAEEPELVSRPMQASWGLLTGVMTYATAFGGLFALVFAVAYGRASVLGPRAVSAFLALLGFISVYIVPNLKYPANPPSVGHPDTIGIRTALYFAMMALSIAAMVGAVILRKRLLPKYGAWSATLIASAVYLAAVIIAAVALAPINEVPITFPAAVLWHFRIDSLAMQAIMWATLGLVFGALTESPPVKQLHRPGGRPKAAWR